MQLSGCRGPLCYAKRIVKAEGAMPFFRSLPVTVVSAMPLSLS